MELLIIRHAEPAYPADALTPEGERQAGALARYLSALGIDELWSSPMGRARATADPVAQATGLAVQVESWLAELESWALSEGTPQEAPAWEADPAALRANPQSLGEGWAAASPFEGLGLEGKIAELRAGSDAFLRSRGLEREGAVYRVTGGPLSRVAASRVAVICHCGLALTWLALLLEIPPPRFWAAFALAPASVTTVRFQSLGGGLAVPRCVALGDRSYLASVPDLGSP